MTGGPDAGAPTTASPYADTPDAASPYAGAPDTGSPGAGSPSGDSPVRRTPDAGPPHAGSPIRPTPDTGPADGRGPDLSGLTPFDYVVLRAAPRIQRGEFVNVGVVLYCRGLDFLGAAWDVDPARLRALDPAVDVDVVCASLEHIRAICAGDPAGGPAATTRIGERFRWLAAPRSTVVHPGPIHSGLTANPPTELDRLLDAFVR